MSDLILTCENIENSCKPSCDCQCDTCRAVRYIGRLEKESSMKDSQIKYLRNYLKGKGHDLSVHLQDTPMTDRYIPTDVLDLVRDELKLGEDDGR